MSENSIDFLGKQLAKILEVSEFAKNYTKVFNFDNTFLESLLNVNKHIQSEYDQANGSVAELNDDSDEIFSVNLDNAKSINLLKDTLLKKIEIDASIGIVDGLLQDMDTYFNTIGNHLQIKDGYFTTQEFKLDTVLDATVSYPLESTPDGSSYIEIPFQDTHKIKLFINIDLNLLENTVRYDYFGSGEFYVNPGNKIILGASEKLTTIFNTGFNSSNGALRVYPSQHSDNRYSFMMDISPFSSIPVSAYRSETDEITSWVFRAEDFFVLSDQLAEKNNTQNNPTPTCVYLSLHIGDKIKITSPEYKFANHVEYIPTCSCPARSIASTVTYCTQSAERLDRCDHYLSTQQTITNVTVNKVNSNNSEIFQVNYFMSADQRHVFKIINTSNNSIVNQFIYPIDHSYSECLVEVEATIEEYMSCYDNDEVTYSQITSELSQNVIHDSFIESLLVKV